MKRFFVSCLGLLIACMAHAQTTYTYGGCTDRQGRAIVSVLNERAPLTVQTVVENDVPEIHYNPQRLPRLLPQTRFFLYAQECAWNVWGFPAEKPRTRADAAKADCAAIHTMINSGFLTNQTEAELIQSDLQLTDQEWAAMPAPKHEFNLAQCYEQALHVPSPQTSPSDLQLDSLRNKPADEKWDRCVQVCADKLLRCERQSSRMASGCMQSYDQCNAGCK